MIESRLREMRGSDLEQVLAWRNHPEIRRFMYTQHEISLDEHRRWYACANDDPATHLLIFELNAAAVGFVKFVRPSTVSRIADWGFYLAPDSPSGTGRELGRAAMTYAFQELMLHKICGQVLAFNEKSIRFHHRLGFQQEGCLREQHFDGTSYHDVICFGLLRQEWKLKTDEVS